LHLIKKRRALMTPLAGRLQLRSQDPGLQDLAAYRHPTIPAPWCTDPRRDPYYPCRGRRRRALWSWSALIRRTRSSCLGATLSPLDGVARRPTHRRAVGVRARPSVERIILALKATRPTAEPRAFITDLLQEAGVRVTLPRPWRAVGVELDIQSYDEAICPRAITNARRIWRNAYA